MAFEQSLNKHMKTIRYIFFKSLLFAFLVFAFADISIAQDGKNKKSDKTAHIKDMIGAQRYIFKAQSATPSRGGRLVQLSSEYDLTVSKDTVRSYLPYFGRAYSAPIDGRGGGIDFTSINFEYNQKERKKGGWDITIRPKDITDPRELLLTVFDNGSASLRVLSNNREPISFNGYIAEKQ
jgi:hypothetical protein